MNRLPLLAVFLLGCTSITKAPPTVTEPAADADAGHGDAEGDNHFQRQRDDDNFEAAPGDFPELVVFDQFDIVVQPDRFRWPADAQVAIGQALAEGVDGGVIDEKRDQEDDRQQDDSDVDGV